MTVVALQELKTWKSYGGSETCLSGALQLQVHQLLVLRELVDQGLAQEAVRLPGESGMGLALIGLEVGGRLPAV